MSAIPVLLIDDDPLFAEILRFELQEKSSDVTVEILSQHVNVSDVGPFVTQIALEVNVPGRKLLLVLCNNYLDAQLLLEAVKKGEAPPWAAFIVDLKIAFGRNSVAAANVYYGVDLCKWIDENLNGNYLPISAVLSDVNNSLGGEEVRSLKQVPIEKNRIDDIGNKVLQLCGLTANAVKGSN